MAIHSVKKYVQFLKTKERYNQNAIFQHLTGEPEHSIAPLYLRVKARGYEDVILPRISFKEGASIFYQSSFDDEKCRKPKKEWENTFFAFYVPETDDYELLCWKQQHGKELKRVIANSVYVILTFNQKGDVDWSYETKNTGSEIPCLVSKYVKCTSAEMEVTRLLKAGYTPYHPIPDIKAQSVYPHAFSLITNSDAEWWEDLFLEISKKQSEVKSRSYDYKCETDFIIAEGDITESNVKVISGKAEDSKDKAKDSKSKPGKYYKFMRHLFRITPDEIPRTPKAFMQSIKRIKNIVVSQM
ncbi:MAG: hypothetical protein KDK55_04795 [Chlamydiia bacterium]|nr:hypothetical protein [Chlamydiia bacterium]